MDDELPTVVFCGLQLLIHWPNCRFTWWGTTFSLFRLCFYIQCIPRKMHTDFALLCFVVVVHWPIFPYPPGLLRWHCGNLTIAPVPAKQPWWIWINTSCEIIMNDYITTTKQSTTKSCAYLLGYTVCIYIYLNVSRYYDTLSLFTLFSRLN